jgi:hypothetical protein
MSAEEAQDGLESLNAMLSTWRLEGLMAYDIERVVFAVTAGTQVYSIGPSGDWNTSPTMTAQATRPTKIEAMGLIDTSSDPDLETPLAPMSNAEYQSLGLKAMTSDWPTRWNYSASVPLGSVFLWPKPTVNRSMAVYLWRQLTTWATVQTNLTLPDGYEEAVVYNLAIRLTPEYGGQASPEVIDVARSSKSLVMRMNTEIPTLDLDPRCPGQRTWGRWNPLTDSYV